MALIANKDTFAFAAMGHGVMQRRFVKGGDALPFGLEPAVAGDFHESADEPAGVVVRTRKAKPLVDADEVKARAEDPEAEIVAADTPDEGVERDPQAAPPGPVASRRSQHPSRRRAGKDAGHSGKDAD